MPHDDPTLTAATAEFHKTKAYAERAFAQLRDEDLFFRLSDRQCSIAAYIRHLSGNMRSRWVNLLTSDGEKPDRDRESEFAEDPIPRESLMQLWELGWAALFSTLASLQPGDLDRTVYIRNEPHSVITAIVRQIAHYAWHVGQIALIAKHIKTLRGETWDYLTIPPRRFRRVQPLKRNVEVEGPPVGASLAEPPRSRLRRRGERKEGSKPAPPTTSVPSAHAASREGIPPTRT